MIDFGTMIFWLLVATMIILIPAAGVEGKQLGLEVSQERGGNINLHQLTKLRRWKWKLVALAVISMTFLVAVIVIGSLQYAGLLVPPAP